MRGSVKHLFEEFQNSLWDGRENCQDVPHKERALDHSRLHEIAHGARQRKAFLPGELQPLRKALCELLSEESCAEWLGFNDLSRPDTLPPSRLLASLVREPDWTEAENIHKLRMYRAAVFIDVLRPGVLDWHTPHDPHMGLVSEFIAAFTRPGISAEEQTDLIEDLARPLVPLETIVRTERGPRLKLSPSELRYVWETNGLSHEERAIAWDSRTPKPFQPFGRSNLEMCQDEKLKHRWRTAVNHQRDKAKALYGSDPGHDEGEAI
jgi:hypothetical protein